jgi:hypothetical protein
VTEVVCKPTKHHYAPWVVVCDRQRTFYESRNDAWSYALHLARKLGAVAIRIDSRGHKEQERVSFADNQEAPAAAEGR